jgi:phosphoribosyl 1,2-cyclic phosphodiesterase
VKVVLWGTRGSLAAPGADTARYGGNTSCVEVCCEDGHALVLDAGTGIRLLGTALMQKKLRRVDLLLTHLHMDHIQGLGFFAPLYVPGLEVHLWGPPSSTMSLRTRLGRYMSPPLFPVRLRDLPCKLMVHEVPTGIRQVGAFTIEARLVCHPGPTVGYRVSSPDGSFAYIPDHEPSLGIHGPLLGNGWTSGHNLAKGVDLLVHDAQYDDNEYNNRIGWGHSPMTRAIEFATLTESRKLVFFHHDPSHDDVTLESLASRAIEETKPSMPVLLGAEGTSFEI